MWLFCHNFWTRNASVATILLALRWMCDSPRTGCARRTTIYIYMWRKQAIIEWSRRVNSIVACYHGAKLCAHTTRGFSDRNTRKLIKCSKASDYSLISNNSLIQKPPSSGRHLRPDDFSPKCLNVPNLWRHPQKTQNKKLYSTTTSCHSTTTSCHSTTTSCHLFNHLLSCDSIQPPPPVIYSTTSCHVTVTQKENA